VQHAPGPLSDLLQLTELLLTYIAISRLRDAGAEASQENDLQDLSHDDFLGGLAALGGSAGNGDLRRLPLVQVGRTEGCQRSAGEGCPDRG
jgi:hypothetical protein